MTCPKCGAANPSDASFCSSCGENIDGATSKQTADSIKPNGPMPKKWMVVGIAIAALLGLGAGWTLLSDTPSVPTTAAPVAAADGQNAKADQVVGEYEPAQTGSNELYEPVEGSAERAELIDACQAYVGYEGVLIADSLHVRRDRAVAVVTPLSGGDFVECYLWNIEGAWEVIFAVYGDGGVTDSNGEYIGQFEEDSMPEADYAEMQRWLDEGAPASAAGLRPGEFDMGGVLFTCPESWWVETNERAASFGETGVFVLTGDARSSRGISISIGEYAEGSDFQDQASIDEIFSFDGEVKREDLVVDGRQALILSGMNDEGEYHVEGMIQSPDSQRFAHLAYYGTEPEWESMSAEVMDIFSSIRFSQAF